MGASSRSFYPVDREAMASTMERGGVFAQRYRAAKTIDGPSGDVLSHDDLAAKARTMLRGRRARDRLFGGAAMFGEPAWDLMLDLFVAEASGQRVTVSSAAVAAHVAPTTALRWIDKLIRLGFLEREPDDFDRRRHYLRLSERAEELMRRAITAS